jgi:hypothetical protein
MAKGPGRKAVALAASIMGRVSTPKKTRAARRNGKLGGRPRKERQETIRVRYVKLGHEAK